MSYEKRIIKAAEEILEKFEPYENFSSFADMVCLFAGFKISEINFVSDILKEFGYAARINSKN